MEPIHLEGPRVRLEPLEPDHYETLCEIGLDRAIWEWLSFPVTTPSAMRAYFEEAFAHRAAGIAYPFVTIDKISGQIVGSTRYANMDLFNKRVEIGWTWVIPNFQRTYVNTEAKFLMLRHAFEEMDCRRVELKTDALNQKSRNAILRLGAKEEGTLRSHMTTATDRRRDTVYFSILSSEWPTVKESLLAKLQAPA